MKRITKHSFEAVSLLIADNGQLDVTIIPAMNQPDWIIPSRNIIEIAELDERIWTYLWRGQEVAVCHLIPSDVTPSTLLVLEGNTDVHRIGLQTVGELRYKKVQISDVKDIPLPEQYRTSQQAHTPEEEQANLDSNERVNSGNDVSQSQNDTKSLDSDLDHSESQKFNFEDRFDETVVQSYLFQCVEVDGEAFLIPDLDKIAHHLVDLDS